MFLSYRFAVIFHNRPRLSEYVESTDIADISDISDFVRFAHLQSERNARRRRRKTPADAPAGNKDGAPAAVQIAGRSFFARASIATLASPKGSPILTYSG